MCSRLPLQASAQALLSFVARLVWLQLFRRPLDVRWPYFRLRFRPLLRHSSFLLGTAQLLVVLGFSEHLRLVQSLSEFRGILRGGLQVFQPLPGQRRLARLAIGLNWRCASATSASATLMYTSVVLLELWPIDRRKNSRLAPCFRLKVA